MRSGVQHIAAERKRQREEEGWSASHDDGHRHGQIASAAAAYALPPSRRNQEILGRTLWRILWPWPGWWKPGNRIRELTKAGALCAAEIDRLQRLPQRLPDEEG